MRVLRKGSRGRDVQRWQRFLIRRGLLRGRADGIFGPLTAAATIAFQRRNGLTADGIAGPATLGRAGFLPPAKPSAPVTPPEPVVSTTPITTTPITTTPTTTTPTTTTSTTTTPTTTTPTTTTPTTTTPTTTPWSAVDTSQDAAGPRVAVTAPLLRQVMPNIPPGRSVEYAPFLQQAMDEFAIDRPPRAAAFLAQLAHESGQLRFMEEIWGPTPAQCRYEPPTRLAACLGNTEPGDGKRFKGRGPIQLTGRANYRVFGNALGLDLAANPALAATKEVAFRIAGLYWRKRGLNALADQHDFRRITKLINGGFNGLIDRLRFWDRAKDVFNVRSLSQTTARGMRQLVPPDEAPDLSFHRGLDEGRDPTPTVVERSAAALRDRERATVKPARRAPAKKAARPAAGKKRVATRKTVVGKKSPAKKVVAKKKTPVSKVAAARTRTKTRAAAVRKKTAARAKKPASSRRSTR